MAHKLSSKPTARLSKQRTRQQDFYEHIPATYAPPVFGAKYQQEESTMQQPVRRRILQQLGLLIGLLVAQIILFVVLIQSTIQLG